MGWFKQLCLWLAILSAVSVSCQEPELTSTLRAGNRTCLGDEVIFTCLVRESTLSTLVLEWTSPGYISGSLQFSSIANMRGDTRMSTIEGSVTANATLTNNAVVDGVLTLESELRIVAGEDSMVTCSGSNGGTKSIEFSVSALPGTPQIASATLISRLMNNNIITCIILVQWNPPANSIGSDIDRYIIYVPSRNINVTSIPTLSPLTVMNCDVDVRVQVAAVSGLGCVGPNSSEVQPDLLVVPTEDGSVTTATIEDGTASTSSPFSVGAAVGVTIAALILVLLLILIVLISFCIFYMCIKKKSKQGATEDLLLIPSDSEKKETDRSHSDEDQEIESLEREAKYILEITELRESEIRSRLLDLYGAINSSLGIKNAVEDLSAGLRKSSIHNIKDALKKSLETLKSEKHDVVQRALDKLMEIIPDEDMSSIHDAIKNIVKELRDKAKSASEDENALYDLVEEVDDLIEKVNEAAPETIQDILLKLCVKLLENLEKLTPQQERVVNTFDISLESLKAIEKLLTAEFVKGLEREEDDVMVKMLVTHVHPDPVPGRKLKELEGDFLVVDFEGRYLRVLHIKIRDRKMEQDSAKFVVDLKTKTSSQQVLFDFIAESVAKFIKNKNIRKKLPVGFVFSFPVKQESLQSGKLICWAKGFNVGGADDKDVVQLLKDAFDRKHVTVGVVALINNTTATLLAARSETPQCDIGLILGEGTNACYMERLDAVPKIEGDREHHSHVIIDTEWGAFGDDGKLDKWRTKYDRKLADEDISRGQYRFEKMISDKYLGEIVRLALKELIGQKALFGGELPPRFDQPEAFSTPRLCVIEKGDCKKMFKNHFSIDVSDEDCEVVRRVCEAVSTRASRLAAAGIVALVKKIDKIGGCTVAVNGGLYTHYPKFPERVKYALNELAPGNKITMKLTKDGPSRGAVIAAAMATAAEEDGSPRGPVGSTGQQKHTYANVEVPPLAVNIEMDEVPRSTV